MTNPVFQRYSGAWPHWDKVKPAMQIKRSEEWWLRTAEAEEGVIGGGSLPNPLDEEGRVLMRQAADKIEKARDILIDRSSTPLMRCIALEKLFGLYCGFCGGNEDFCNTAAEATACQRARVEDALREGTSREP